MSRRGALSCGRSRLLPVLLALVLAFGWLLGLPVRAAADGPDTFTNSTLIAIPGIGDVAPRSGPASPYPSTITVSGMTGSVSEVTVTLTNLTHDSVADVDVLLVAPTGENLLLLSDLGDPVNPGDPFQLVVADDDTLTFDDSASGTVPRQFNMPGGTYLPSNTGSGDTFPGAAPTPSSLTRFDDAFTGINPNGAWQLFINDDIEGEVGELEGGWSLTITTEEAAVATTTTITSSDASSLTGQPVTFTATVTAGGSPVTTGSVQFRDGTSNIGPPTAVNTSGVAAFTTGALTEGNHEIRAAYLGATGFQASTSGPLAQRVDNATVVTGSTFCNPGTITTPANVGASTPYPSNIFVTGLAGEIVKVTAELRGVDHSSLSDLDVLLAGPTASQNLFLLSDAGGNTLVPVDDDLTFDDDAAGLVPNPVVTGSYLPTNRDDDSDDAMPGPAPAPSSATELSTFNGSSPNGTWSLWVVDDASGDFGSIADGWCLTIEAQVETGTALTAVPTSSIFDQSVTFTATVTAGDDPVEEGTVEFRDGATVLGTDDLAADGTATFTTADLTVGTHDIAAAYLGTDTNAPSASDVLPYVVSARPTQTDLTSSTNPSDVGEPVTFTATVTDDGDPVTQGTVQFSIDGADVGGPVTLNASGLATHQSDDLAAGTHEIEAAYSGTATQAGSTDSLDQVVQRLVPTGTLAADPGTSQVDQQVTFTATFTVDGSPATPGTVDFSDGATTLCADVAVDASGVATCDATFTTAATHPIVATFAQTDTYAQATADLSYVVGLIPTSTTLATSGSPSDVGEEVTFTATVTRVEGGAAVTAGTVQFHNGATGLGDPVPVSTAGVATLPTAVLPAGEHTITASYEGTTQFAASISDPVVQVVERIGTATALDSSPNPSEVGQEVTFTATVTRAEGGAAVTSGTVQFRNGAADLGAPVPVDASGEASYPIDDLPAGVHSITATFLQTEQFGESSSNTVTQLVNRIGTATALTSSLNPSEVGQEVTFTATVTRTGGGAAVTPGAVQFRNGAADLGAPVPVDASGVATYPIDDLDAGTHVISAVFLETAEFGESPSNTVDQVVRPPAADAGRPYSVAEGESLTLNGSGSVAGVTYGWDLNGDDEFTDATGENPTLTWAQLEALGIDDGLSPAVTRTIRLQVTLGGIASVPTEAQLTVTNTAPASVLTGDLTATVGVPFTIKVGADDPSTADMDAQFTYTVDWGDGSPVVSLPGPADPPVTHIYLAEGDYAVTFTATDKDGGTGPGTRVVVVAQRAPISSPTPTPTTTSPPDDDDGDDYDSDGTSYGSDYLASTGSTVGIGTLVAALLLLGIGAGLVFAGRRRSGRRQG